MEQAILTFINYIHRIKGTSENTEVSYRRDLTKLADYLTAEAGISDWSLVTATDLNSYMLYMEKNIQSFEVLNRKNIFFFQIKNHLETLILHLF